MKAKTSTLPQSSPLLSTAIDDAASYLVRHLDDAGRFDYFRRSYKSPTKYNLLRHAGAIYSLIAYHRVSPRNETRAAILRASAYLLERYLRPLRDRPDLLAAFSRPDEESVVRPTAKLGGAALTLLALLGAKELQDDLIALPALRRLGSFIVFMQTEDGSFHSKYSDEAGYDPTFHSLYYPGEAMLALSTLYSVDLDPRWIHGALSAAKQIIVQRNRSSKKPPADHWMMLASVPMLAYLKGKPDAETGVLSYEELANHVELLASHIQSDQVLAAPPGSLQALPAGSLGPSGRSTPSATRLEGLSALAAIQKQQGALKPSLRKTISRGIAFLLRCQIRQESEDLGGMPRSCKAQDKHKRAGEIRIDYVQHALSAWIAAQTLGIAPDFL